MVSILQGRRFQDHVTIGPTNTRAGHGHHRASGARSRSERCGFQSDLEAILVPSNLRVGVDEVYIRRDRLVLEDQAHFHQRCEECCGLQVAGHRRRASLVSESISNAGLVTHPKFPFTLLTYRSPSLHKTLQQCSFRWGLPQLSLNAV